jgi:two-component system, chemotaxis family, sensor kinase CheA
MTKAKYNFDDAINAFFIESREMLEDMENALLELEKDTTAKEPIPAIFRAAHTIKGSAGMFGLNEVGEFTHIVEDLLDGIRNDKITVVPEMVSLLLECHDHILKLLDFFDGSRGGTIDIGLKSRSNNLIVQLNSYMGVEVEKKIIEKAVSEEEPGISEIKVINECWHISLRFGANVYKYGLDPRSFITYLGQMGKIIKIKTLLNASLSFMETDPECCYLGFEINFMGITTKEKIEEVFEFVRDDCKIRILSPGTDLSGYVKLIEDLPEEPMQIGEILTEIGSLTKKELEEALKLQAAFAADKKNKRIGEVVVDEKMVHQPVVDAAVSKQNKIGKSDDRMKKTMRIDGTKLDGLINLVGELVISAANAEQTAKNSGDNKLIKSFSQMSRLIDDIREKSMKIRMVQISELFMRFERLVHDISREKKKKIDLVLNGGETELDKIIIEKVSDPLMHLVRNAIDHGIELPEERIQKGKPPVGKVLLNAFHEGGDIVIEIIDDGYGLNREKIIKKAIEKGVMTLEQSKNVTDNDINNLIFSPGFSTADKVTDISGRGVGMDVVKKNIESLRGSVVVQSKEGQGTSVRIYLPLTLAIIDGFLVKAGEHYCIFSLNTVVECINVSKSKDELNVNGNGNFINLRGDLVPFLRIRDFFKEQGQVPEHESIVIVRHAKNKVGFIVDSLYGSFQTVVKPMGKVFKKLEWISGATILGGGELGFILDVPKLIQYIQAGEIKKAS